MRRVSLKTEFDQGEMITFHSDLIKKRTKILFPPYCIEELKEAKNAIVEDGGDEIIKNSSPSFPRYIRVNTLKTTAEKAIKALKQCFQNCDGIKNSLKEHRIFADPHVPDLLVTSTTESVKWHENELSTSGKIVLQVKLRFFIKTSTITLFANFL